MENHRMSRRQSHRTAQPIRHPFIEIGGDVYMMLDWFDLDDGVVSRNRIALVRLTAKELALYDECRTTADSVGNVLPLVERRLGRQRHRRPV
jgi:hypothetical protein